MTPVRPGRKAADPFFNPAHEQLPQDFKQLLRYSRDYYLLDPLVSDIAYKMAEYPITPIIVETPTGDEDLKRRYETIFRDIRLKETLISIGLDYNIFGISLVTLNIPIKRYFICSKCGEVLEPKGDLRSGIVDRDEKVNWGIQDKQLAIFCEKCGVRQIVEIKDELDPESSDYSIRRWDPLNIDLEYNPLAETYDFIYTIPPHLLSNIKTKVQYLKETPIIFIQAALNNKNAVRLYRNKVIMLKRPSPASDSSGWGVPPITHVLNTMYYLGMLRKANAHIAQDSLVKYRYVAPGSLQMGPYPPNALASPTPNLGVWAGNMLNQIEKWRDSPNDIALFPIPVNAGSIGGDGRALMVWPEIKNLEEEIISGMQVPQEFVKGGLSWSGSSVSLRMLENHFINYRDMLESVLDKLVTAIAVVKDIPKPVVRFREFKMADDQMRKQTFMSLNANKKISDTTLLNEFDLDHETELKQMVKEAKNGEKLYAEELLMHRRAEVAANSKLQSEIASDIINVESAALPDFFYKALFEAGSMEDLYNSPSLNEFMDWLNGLSPQAQNQVVAQVRDRFPLVYAVLSGSIAEQAPAEPEQVSGNMEASAQPDTVESHTDTEKELPEKNPPRRKNSPV